MWQFNPIAYLGSPGQQTNLYSMSVNTMLLGLFFWVFINMLIYNLSFFLTSYLYLRNESWSSFKSVFKKEPETLENTLFLAVSQTFSVTCLSQWTINIKAVTTISWHMPTHCCLFTFSFWPILSYYLWGGERLYSCSQEKSSIHKNGAQKNSFPCLYF